ncbi:hypothetical protein QFZ75_003200 [Streptomyces sp. V3I8]|uniref:hypothetical protein n=1 Tax=Streptomyces sp. V3I8 TaxID=3042279 RepID=UPI002789BDE8|nr:hypothetical protein [Streptomyces sp. V3I8]MDQ1036784.1 hypothetical protein [Streptomyces sp. V3I8]
MSEITGQSRRTGQIPGGPEPRTAAADTVHESYSFACMRCGHGWEQSYEIEHHFDAEGTQFVTYVADGLVVPSPLSRPSCVNCDGNLLRIMRAGQVSSAQNPMRRTLSVPPMKRAAAIAAPDAAPDAAQSPETALRPDAAPRVHHHWHLSDLLHPFQHRKAV